MKTVAYLRVSTEEQDTDKFKADVLMYANGRRFGHVEFVEEKVSGRKPWRERRIAGVIDDLGKGDNLIVPELSRLGRSTLDVLEILEAAKKQGVAVYSVKENFQLTGDDLMAKVMTQFLALFATVEREFISLRTKEGLRKAKASGKRLGRPRGPGKSKLDKYRPEIEALLKNGSTKAFICKRYKCGLTTLLNWLKKNNINSLPVV
ncbi:recombinase family protein [Thermodesulfobacteriota bacterium]